MQTIERFQTPAQKARSSMIKAATAADHAERFARADAYIAAHFAEGITFADAAKVANLSPYHFHRTYSAWKGNTPKRVIAEHQVELAKRLMLQGVPLVDVAAKCGFCHQSYFTSRFKQVAGMTPTAFLKAELAKR